MTVIDLVIAVVFLIVGAALGYFFHRYQADIARKNQQEKADNILKGASEQARLIESQAGQIARRCVNVTFDTKVAREKSGAYTICF